MSPKLFKYIGLLSGAALLLSGVFVACKKDFLDQSTIGVLTEAEAQSAKGARQFLVATYSALKGQGWEGGGSNWVFGSISGGEANKGSDAGDQADVNPIQQFTHTPTNNYFNVKWRSLYEGVARANSTIRILDKLTDKDISADEKNQILAEARFLRGYYHFEAKKLWNNIPYVDETVTYDAQNFKVANSTDWTKIMEDLDFARNNLPATQSQVGRVNSWAAKAFYAKALLFQGKHAEALPIFTDVINNGVTSGGLKYALAPAFHDMFNAEKENEPSVRAESVFAYEASVNEGSGGNNANFDQILNFPYDESGAAPGGCCGFFQPSFEFVNSFRTTAQGLPLLDGSYNTGANQVKNDQGVAKTQPFTPDAGNLDPRLDWTVGRRGIPYLDWGNHPGVAWIRDQGNGGPFAPLKNVYHKSQKGTLTDGTSWTSGLTAINYKIMRFADVLLMAAECEIEAGSLANALKYVNMVRARAAKPETWVKTYVNPADPSQGFTTTPAANYVISTYTSFTDQNQARAAVRLERKLELGQEGHRFFDLVRWGIADQAINAFLAYEKTKLSAAYGGASFEKGKHEYFPIPQRQIDLSTTAGVSALTQNPKY
jgi:starch-binding outer membrane protein, SusD/RagB family